MFRETLLESSPNRKRNRWPIALAVVLEATVCAGLIALPLLSTGVISVAAHPPKPVPLDQPPIPKPPESVPASGARGGAATSAATVVNVTKETTICFHCVPPENDQVSEVLNLNVPIDRRGLPNELALCANCRSAGPTGPTRIISNLSPGSLIYRVEPVYPKMAALVHVRGIVRLHAIIATDGTIQSLNVIDGHPLLIAAAREAVRKWRYSPYILNGHPVEVETMITVNFKGID